MTHHPRRQSMFMLACGGVGFGVGLFLMGVLTDFTISVVAGVICTPVNAYIARESW